MIKKIPLITLLFLIGFALSQEAVVEKKIYVAKFGKAEGFGEVYSYIIKGIQMLALVMLCVDLICRYYGVKLYWMHVLRFCIFVYGACCPWLLGGNNNHAPQGYRGFMDKVGYHFFDLIYHGYWGTGYLSCFNHRLTVDGIPYGFNYINILPIEILLFMLGKAFVWSSWDEFHRKNRWVHCWSTIKGMYLEFYGFPYAGWATFFFKQHFDMIELEERGHVVDGRNDIVYWISMSLAIWMTWETIRSIWEVYTGNRDTFSMLHAEDPRQAGYK
jgi:hypothetical protein